MITTAHLGIEINLVLQDPSPDTQEELLSRREAGDMGRGQGEGECYRNRRQEVHI